MIYEMLYQSEILKDAAQISVLSLLAFLWCRNFADLWQVSKFTCKKYEILIVKVGNIKNTAEKSALSQLDCLPGGSSADWWHQFIAISQKEPSGEETAKIKENHTRTKSPPFLAWQLCPRTFFVLGAKQTHKQNRHLHCDDMITSYKCLNHRQALNT